MRLIFLGTGGYHPNERRHTACLLLPDIGIALDAGTGFFRVQDRLQTKELDVFLSHGHLDHVCGLTFFLVPVLTGQVTRFRVHGQADVLNAVRTHLFHEQLFPVNPPYEWCPLPADQHIILQDGACLRHCALEHPGGATGFRIDWPDRSLAYITDTTAPGTYGSFVNGVDVLIHECYFPDDMQEWAVRTGHSHSAAVARLAADAGVSRLYLVHADPQKPDNDPIGMDSIRRIFPNTILAEDLMEIEF
ncbi:MAG: ribonuclease Z [Planctomycetaceae bacterium]|nr:ribonuclease Z [Planctomycetaceae bacterium]